MRNVLICITLIGVSGTATRGAVVVAQLNTNLDAQPGNQWEAVTSPNIEITIKQANSQHAYIFHVYDDVTSDLQPIRRISRDVLLTNGDIRLIVSAATDGSTPGASTIGAILIDEAGNDNITSYLDGINITGDFLGESVMVADNVTGALVFGDSTGNAPLNAMTIGSLTGDITAGSTGVGGDITIGGNFAGGLTVTGDMACDSR